MELLGNAQGFLHEFFWLCETEVAQWKKLVSPFCFKKFRYPKFYVTSNGSSTKTFGSVRQKKFRQNRDALSALCNKTFDTGFFSKHRRVPLRQFSGLCERTFSTENNFINCFCLKLFYTLNFLKQGKVPPRSFLAP